MTHFSEAAAQALVGRRYRATQSYVDVPVGTVGQVVSIYPTHSGWGVNIAWEDLPSGGPTVDGFTRMDLWLMLVHGEHQGERAMVPLDGPDGGPLGGPAARAICPICSESAIWNVDTGRWEHDLLADDDIDRVLRLDQDHVPA